MCATPAARAYLRRAGREIDTDRRRDQPLRLADVVVLADEAATPEAEPRRSATGMASTLAMLNAAVQVGDWGATRAVSSLVYAIIWSGRKATLLEERSLVVGYAEPESGRFTGIPSCEDLSVDGIQSALSSGPNGATHAVDVHIEDLTPTPAGPALLPAPGARLSVVLTGPENVVVADTMDGDNAIAIRTIINVSVTFDIELVPARRVAAMLAGLGDAMAATR